MVKLKGWKRFCDVLFTITIIKTTMELFWIPITGMSSGKFFFTLAILFGSLQYLFERMSEFQITVRSYHVGGSSLSRISIKSKEGELSNDD